MDNRKKVLTQKLNYRLTEDELNKVKEMAEKEGRTISNFVRRVIQEEIKRHYAEQF